jgi:hypothetical protein
MSLALLLEPLLTHLLFVHQVLYHLTCAMMKWVYTEAQGQTSVMFLPRSMTPLVSLRFATSSKFYISFFFFFIFFGKRETATP